ncbi:MAG: ParB/RepB/Spo0J family partition protein [Acidaminococcaceae bacterium]|nr:ParB/RepB/Spo0J family partition protein [Acidaminococcaceae bacterium]MBQ6423930.1 ParB/RepB/Spo0J family partition protein [Acidaminococcaceae bacterium]MBQ6429083.1 ParB/RepB/Spo0J family partition protein [Acidaminococcaceae bacterium]MBQ6745036.1 ParB/RepB/Spo0J family partition protein [Acidaminococcaceae bacterium]MBQ6778377.1 ParB/RepB/Spo0J family partition protein [Acidaminococcaceae bacterium]
MQDGFNDLNVETLKTDHLQKNTDVQVLQVPLSKIVPNPYQPRKEFESEALSELADSIRQYGVLQPLLVAPGKDGTYILIAGERRLRASIMAGLGTVPVIVSEYTTQQIAEIALIENLQRKDLHYLEEAEGYEKLVNTFHLTQESMAIRVGKKQSTIANKLRLLRLPVSVRNKLHDSKLTERHARVLLKLENEETQKAVLQKVLKGNLNVRQTEALVEKTLKENGKLDKKKPRIVIVNDVRIYLNSIREIMETVKTSGIPASMEQDMDGDDVVLTLRIKNVKKRKDPKVIKLF